MDHKTIDFSEELYGRPLTKNVGRTGRGGEQTKWAEEASKSNANAKPRSQWVSHWQLIILFCHPHIGDAFASYPTFALVLFSV